MKQCLELGVWSTHRQLPCPLFLPLLHYLTYCCLYISFLVASACRFTMSLSGAINAITPIVSCDTVLYAQAVLFFQAISDMRFRQKGAPYNNFDVITVDNKRLRLSLILRKLGRMYPSCLAFSADFWQSGLCVLYNFGFGP